MTNAELNKLAAEKVMGWHEYGDGILKPDSDEPLYVNNDFKEVWKWNPCESIADAWMLLEKLDWFWFQVGRENCDGVRWDVRTYDDYDCKAEDEINVTCEDTAPLAITKACLKAAGVKV